MAKTDAENPCNHAEMQPCFPKNLETYRFWKSGNHSIIQHSIKNHGGNMRHKKILNSLILLLTAALLISCEESTGLDNGEDPKPPGYQEEIPWPSLADSPWPMYHHDPQNTGRTNFGGPLNGIINHEFEDRVAVSNALIGVDSSLFIMDAEGFHSYDLNFNLNWSIGGGSTSSYGSAIISSESTIYLRLKDIFMAINYDGDIVWQKEIKDIANQNFSIGKDGTIFMIGRNRELVAIDNKDGEKKWTIPGYPFASFIGMSFSPNGDFIYIIGVNEENKGLFAVNTHSRSIEWSFGKGFFRYANPVVDYEGNIYTITKLNEEFGFFALTPEGEMLWSFELTSDVPDSNFYYTPTIDKNGNFFLGLDTLYSLDYNGNLRWKRDLSQYTPPETTIDSDIICDSMGNIYFAAQSGTDDRLFILGFDNTGNLLFDRQISSIRGIAGFSPVIGYQNELIIAQYLDKITIIKE